MLENDKTKKKIVVSVANDLPETRKVVLYLDNIVSLSDRVDETVSEPLQRFGCDLRDRLLPIISEQLITSHQQVLVSRLQLVSRIIDADEQYDRCVTLVFEMSCEKVQRRRTSGLHVIVLNCDPITGTRRQKDRNGFSISERDPQHWKFQREVSNMAKNVALCTVESIRNLIILDQIQWAEIFEFQQKQASSAAISARDLNFSTDTSAIASAIALNYIQNANEER